MTERPNRVSMEELTAEAATQLPAKEVLSLLDLNINLDLMLDLAAPIDLAVAANANVAAPVDAAVSANVLSIGSQAAGLADQDVLIDQGIADSDAIAEAPQTSTIDQSDGLADAPADSAATASAAETALLEPDAGELVPEVTDTAAGALPADAVAPLLDGNLLNVNVDAALDADITAPVAGAVAANANAAVPIDAAVAANIGSVLSEATAVADQDAVIVQRLEDVTAHAVADQDSEITQ